MRQLQRISVILEHFREHPSRFLKFIKRFGEDEYVESFNKNYDLIKKTWEEYPDLRFGQLLINMELVPDDFTIWSKEEVDFMISNDYLKFDEIAFWGRKYDKDNNKLPKTEWIPLREITDEHAEAILKYFKDRNMNLDERYKKYFESRLNGIYNR